MHAHLPASISPAAPSSHMHRCTQELAHLSQPELRCTLYSQVKVMTVKQLKEQLAIRKRVDGRSKLLLSPPKGTEEKARKWLILKVQQVTAYPALPVYNRVLPRLITPAPRTSHHTD